MFELTRTCTVKLTLVIAVLTAGLVATQACGTPKTTMAPGTVNVRDYGAIGDGVTDDAAAITRACANAAGRTLYVPTGTYRLASRFTVPAGTVFKGDGEGSWLKGPVSVGSGDTFDDLRIGSAGRSCYVGGVENVTFSHVQFVGGGGSFAKTWPFLDSHVLTIGVGGSVRHVLFDGCHVERNGGMENADKSHHFDNVFVLSHVAADNATVKDVLFRACQFAGSPRFNVEVWDEYLVQGGARGTENVDFADCVFEASESASIDYSSYRGGYSTVSGCTFKGNGAGANPKWPDDVTIEKGASHITVTGCHALRGRDMFVGGSGGNNVVTNNVVDGDSGIAHNWTPYISLVGDNNVVTGNHVVSTGPDATVIVVEGNNNVVTGNIVTPPLARASAILVTGTGNTSSPNTVQ